MGIVVEAAGASHRRLQSVLARMAEGWVADVVGQAERFGQILVEAEGAGQGSADLGNLQAVGQPDAEVIAVRRDEDLRLVA
jgi:hypothetical protein